jgi:hypothetical protein
MKHTLPLLATLAFAATLALAQQPPRPNPQQKAGKRPGDQRAQTNLRVGDTAPDFKLKTKDGDRDVQLASFRGKKPVVLVFGSYT